MNRVRKVICRILTVLAKLDYIQSANQRTERPSQLCANSEIVNTLVIAFSYHPDFSISVANYAQRGSCCSCLSSNGFGGVGRKVNHSKSTEKFNWKTLTEVTTINKLSPLKQISDSPFRHFSFIYRLNWIAFCYYCILRVILLSLKTVNLVQRLEMGTSRRRQTDWAFQGTQRDSFRHNVLYFNSTSSSLYQRDLNNFLRLSAWKSRWNWINSWILLLFVYWHTEMYRIKRKVLNLFRTTE